MNRKFIINNSENSCIIGILTEVCNGFKIDQFERRLGAPKETVAALAHKLKTPQKCDSNLSEEDLTLIRRAFYQVKKEFLEWDEFSDRLGFNLVEIKKMSLFKGLIEVNFDENPVIINVLNEVCNGIRIDDFEKKIGEKKTVQNLLIWMVAEVKSGSAKFDLTKKEIELIKRSLIQVVIEFLEYDEFHVRLGMDLDEIKQLPLFREMQW